MSTDTQLRDELLALFEPLSAAQKRQLIRQLRNRQQLPDAPSGREFVENTAHIRMADNPFDEVADIIEEEFGMTGGYINSHLRLIEARTGLSRTDVIAWLNGSPLPAHARE